MALDVVSALSPLLIAAISNYSTIFTVHPAVQSVYKAISTNFNYTSFSLISPPHCGHV